MATAQAVARIAVVAGPLLVAKTYASSCNVLRHSIAYEVIYVDRRNKKRQAKDIAARHN